MEQSIMSYADYIAVMVKRALQDPKNDFEGLIGHVDKVWFDLDEEGAIRSYKKVIRLCDKYGSQYEITVDRI